LTPNEAEQIVAADAGKAPRLFPVASGPARLHFAFGMKLRAL
jgi:hypothetical protein